MVIDLSSVDWNFVGLMTALAFVTALLGGFIAFKSRLLGSIIAAILFGIGFVAWNYYPHNFGLPIFKGTVIDGTVAPATAAPATPGAPAPASPAPSTSH